MSLRGRPTRADLDAARDRTIPDLLPDPLRLLFVGINPSLWSGATGAHYARPGNRFWPALAAAGVTPHVVDASAGWSEADRHLLEELGIGFTNVVARATARADEVSDDELRAGRARLELLVSRRSPRVVAVAGVGAYRVAFGRRAAQVGEQQPIGGARVFVVPNPSGLNAHETVASLARAYAVVAAAARLPHVSFDT